MWFKNIRVFTLENNFDYTAEQLDKLLESQKFTPCSGQDVVKMGWTSVLSDGPLVHQIGDDFFFRCKLEKKMLPSSVVNEELQEKIDTIEQEQARQVKKKEKSDLKEQIITHLLPRAFAIHKEYWVWINAKCRYVFVNAASDKLCDDILSLLRKALGSLPAKPFAFNRSIPECFTEWVNNEKSPVDIEIGDETEMKEIEGAGGVIKAKKQDLSADEIKAHLEAGKVVTSLALTVQDNISFVLDEKFAIKRIKLSDTIVEDYAVMTDDPNALLEADLALMAGEYAKLIPVLIDAFGGELEV